MKNVFAIAALLVASVSFAQAPADHGTAPAAPAETKPAAEAAPAPAKAKAAHGKHHGKKAKADKAE